MSDANTLCIMFNFGVPLEDIFPPRRIHPKLQNLFLEAYNSFRYSKQSLDEVLSGFQESLNDALEIKDAVVNGKLFKNKVTPATYFWLLRHFFGLLPLPLFPRFTNGQSYNWEYLSARCRLNYMRSNWQLESEISWWIHKLPKPNVLLIYTVIDFIRKVCLKRHSSRKLDWNSIKIMSAYFGSSLFFRPYRPGFTSKADGTYDPLLQYLVVKWSTIRRTNLKRVSYVHHQMTLLSNFEDEDIKFEESGCQTSSCLLYKEEPMSSSVKEALNTTLETVGTQTETPQNPTAEPVNLEYCNYNFGQLDKSSCENEENVLNAQSSKTEKLSLNVSLQSQNKLCGDTDKANIYEDIYAEKPCTLNTSKTMIYKKCDSKLVTPKDLFRQKLVRANRSFGSVMSKVKQEMFKGRSNTKLEQYRYNLLKDSVVKVKSLHANYGVKESPYIKYKKLMTL